MALYPNWLILYFLQVIIPMLMLIVTALKILLKNGKVMLREQLGINIYNPKSSPKHVPQSAKPSDTPSTTPSTPISFIYLPTVPQNTPTTPKHISPHHLENTNNQKLGETVFHGQCMFWYSGIAHLILQNYLELRSCVYIDKRNIFKFQAVCVIFQTHSLSKRIFIQDNRNEK